MGGWRRWRALACVLVGLALLANEKANCVPECEEGTIWDEELGDCVSGCEAGATCPPGYTCEEVVCAGSPCYDQCLPPGAECYSTLDCELPDVESPCEWTVSCRDYRCELAASACPEPIDIGVEYGLPGLSSPYPSLGLASAKPQPSYGIWDRLEPQRGQYTWDALDEVVREYQEAGFPRIHLVLSAESRWASHSIWLDHFPRDEYVDDYVAFVTRVVERYDGDGGPEDFEHLRYPIHHYGIERELSPFWKGSTEDYVRLLRLAYDAIHEADPEAEVLPAGILLADVFDGAPPPEVVEERLQETPSWRRSRDEVVAVLGACDAYDAVDLHSLGHYSEIPPTTRWLREQMAAQGCAPDAHPIRIGDAFSMSTLAGYGAAALSGEPCSPEHPNRTRPFFPATWETLGETIAVLQSVGLPEAPDHEAATAWLRQEMARELVKRAVVAAGEGLAGVNIGNQIDWSFLPFTPDHLEVCLAGSSLFMGMTDATSVGGELVPGDPRPAVGALQLTAMKLMDYAAVSKVPFVPIGHETPDGLWVYRFDKGVETTWVLWYDDGALHLPAGPPAPVVEVALPIAGDQTCGTPGQAACPEGVDGPFVLLTESPGCWLGFGAPETVRPVEDGVVHLSVGATPLFVDASPVARVPSASPSPGCPRE